MKDSIDLTKSFSSDLCFCHFIDQKRRQFHGVSKSYHYESVKYDFVLSVFRLSNVMSSSVYLKMVYVFKMCLTTSELNKTQVLTPESKRKTIAEIIDF